MTDLKTMSPIDLDSYLRMKGLLHDGVVRLRCRGDHVVDIEVEDVNCAFTGLLEYRGRVPSVIRLEVMVADEGVPEGTSFRVYEADMDRDIAGYVSNRLTLTFWPAGRLSLTLIHAWVAEGHASVFGVDSSDR